MSTINENNVHRAAKPMVWIKAKSGNTYICPKSAIRDTRNISESELRECLDESENPQNN